MVAFPRHSLLSMLAHDGHMIIVGANNHHEKSVDLTGGVCEMRKMKHNRSMGNKEIAMEKPKAAPDSTLTHEGSAGGEKRTRDSPDVAIFPSAVTRGHADKVITNGNKKCQVGHRSEDPYGRTTGLTINLAVIASDEPIPECPRGKRRRERDEKCAKNTAVDGYGATTTGCRHEEAPVGPYKKADYTGAFPTLPSSLLDRMKRREERFGSTLSAKDSPRNVDGDSDGKREVKVFPLSGDANGVCYSEERPNLGSGRSVLLNQRDFDSVDKDKAKATPRKRRVRFVASAEVIAERAPPAVMEPAGVTSDMALKMARRADRFGVKVARSSLVRVVCIPQSTPERFCFVVTCSFTIFMGRVRGMKE